MNQIINQIERTTETNNQNQIMVMPRSLNAAKVVYDIIDNCNIILCRICEKEKKRSKFVDHFATHFDEQKEVPISIQEIYNLVVPQMEK